MLHRDKAANAVQRDQEEGVRRMTRFDSAMDKLARKISDERAGIQRDSKSVGQLLQELIDTHKAELTEVQHHSKCDVKVTGHNNAIGCEIGQCQCGEIVRSIFKFCPWCGTELGW